MIRSALQTPVPFTIASSAIEGAMYTHLRSQDQNGSVSSQMLDIQALFNSVNVLMTLFYAKKLITHINKSNISFKSAAALYGALTIGMIAAATLAQHKGINPSARLARALASTRIISQLALSYFSTAPTEYLTSAFATFCSQINSTTGTKEYLTFKNIRGSYRTKRIEIERENLDQAILGNTECAICLDNYDESSSPMLVTCKLPNGKYHWAHEHADCLTGYYDSLKNRSQLPLCLSCNEVKQDRWESVRDDVASKENCLDRINTFFNVAQAALAYLQKNNPEFAPVIFRLQSICLFLELASALLSEGLRISRLVDSHDSFYEGQAAVHRSSIMSLTMWFAITPLLTIALQRFSRSSLPSLETALSTLPTNGKMHQTLSVTWQQHPLHTLMQFLLIQRIFSSIMMFKVTGRITHISDIALQAFTLSQISKLRWIRYNGTYSSPIQQALDSGGSAHYTNFYTPSLPRLQQTVWDAPVHAKAFFLVAPDCATNPKSLQSSVESIHDFMKHLFEGSRWMRRLALPLQPEHYYVLLAKPIKPCSTTTPALSWITSHVPYIFFRTLVGNKAFLHVWQSP